MPRAYTHTRALTTDTSPLTMRKIGQSFHINFRSVDSEPDPTHPDADPVDLKVPVDITGWEIAVWLFPWTYDVTDADPPTIVRGAESNTGPVSDATPTRIVTSYSNRAGGLWSVYIPKTIIPVDRYPDPDSITNLPGFTFQIYTTDALPTQPNEEPIFGHFAYWWQNPRPPG